MPLPRTRASLHKTRTTASSRRCDRRPAQDHVGDPRCCSRWGCNSGPERKPACEAIVGGGRHPSLLSGVSDRQLPVDGTVRMPRPQSSRRRWQTAASARRCRSRAARSGRHAPRYCFLCGIGPRPPGRSNRLALTVRVIGLRGTRSCPAAIRTSLFALGPADLAVVLWRRGSHPGRRLGPAQRARSSTSLPWTVRLFSQWNASLTSSSANTESIRTLIEPSASARSARSSPARCSSRRSCSPA